MKKNKESWKPIFIHVPRTGGTTIHHYMWRCLTYPHPHRRHFTVKECIERIGRERWEKTFKFTSVRDPWSRLFSFYKHTKSKPFEKIDSKQYITFHPEENRDICLNEFISLTFEFRKKENYEKSDKTHPAFKDHHEFMMKLGDMTYMLCDDKEEINFDHIIYFENYKKDLKDMIEKLPQRYSVRPRQRNMPHRNPSSSSKPLYTPESCEMIREMMKKEIEHFNFIEPKFSMKKES